MEIGPVTRPGPSNVSPASRVAQNDPSASAGVQLPATAVEQASPAPKTLPDPPRTVDQRPPDHRTIIDPATQQVVRQTLDPASGQVVRQIPEEVMLRLEAYARALRRAEPRRRSRIALRI